MARKVSNDQHLERIVRHHAASDGTYGAQDDARGTVEEQATDLVDRNFAVVAPDQLWVADITDVPTWAGSLYLPVVLDA